MKVKLKRLHPLAQPPKYQREGDAGADLVTVEEGVLLPGQVKAFSTGWAMELEPGTEAQIRSRSGLALKGVIVANAPGTIDSGYRGEVKVILINHGREMFFVNTGDRIAQMVLAYHTLGNTIEEVDELSSSDRGEGGFGSTGK